MSLYPSNTQASASVVVVRTGVGSYTIPTSSSGFSYVVITATGAGGGGGGGGYDPVGGPGATPLSIGGGGGGSGVITVISQLNAAGTVIDYNCGVGGPGGSIGFDGAQGGSCSLNAGQYIAEGGFGGDGFNNIIQHKGGNGGSWGGGAPAYYINNVAQVTAGGTGTIHQGQNGYTNSGAGGGLNGGANGGKGSGGGGGGAGGGAAGVRQFAPTAGALGAGGGGSGDGTGGLFSVNGAAGGAAFVVFQVFAY